MESPLNLSPFYTFVSKNEISESDISAVNTSNQGLTSFGGCCWFLLGFCKSKFILYNSVALVFVTFIGNIYWQGGSSNSSDLEPQKQALETKDKLLDSICKSKLPNEEPHLVNSTKLSLVAAVYLPSDLTKMSAPGGCSITGLEAAADTNSTEPIQSQVSRF